MTAKKLLRNAFAGNFGRLRGALIVNVVRMLVAYRIWFLVAPLLVLPFIIPSVGMAIDGDPSYVIASTLFFLIVLTIAGINAAGNYPTPVETESCDDAIPWLLSSAEQYCLLLRPFGKDGYTQLSRGWRFWWMPRSMGQHSNLEQCIAAVALKSCQLATWAIVDQSQKVAPPGARYIRVDNDRWQDAAQCLIGRAHTIVVILPPGETVRRALQWELQQITAFNVQHRVILVLPPNWPSTQAARDARQQASELTATLQGFARSVDEVTKMEVDSWNKLFTENGHVLTVRPRSLRSRMNGFGVWAAVGRGTVAMRTYAQCLEPAFQLIDQDVSWLPFSARYSVDPKCRWNRDSVE